MLELYHAGRTTCSRKPRLCLTEKGLDYVSHSMNFGLGLLQGAGQAPAMIRSPGASPSASRRCSRILVRLRSMRAEAWRRIRGFRVSEGIRRVVVRTVMKGAARYWAS